MLVPRGEREHIAKVVGVTPETLSLVLNGTRRPSLDLALRLSAALGGQISVEELLSPDEPWPMSARLRREDPVLTPEEVELRELDRVTQRQLERMAAEAHEEPPDAEAHDEPTDKVHPSAA